ncbi:MAG TPA: hypothetical protein VFM65_01565 [Flavobacteriaceae bacterium]|nr:hypothetical protein [Flavobacteriaceae bacterium]
MWKSKKYIAVLILLFLLGICAVVAYINISLEKNQHKNMIEATE